MFSLKSVFKHFTLHMKVWNPKFKNWVGNAQPTSSFQLTKTYLMSSKYTKCEGGKYGDAL